MENIVLGNGYGTVETTAIAKVTMGDQLLLFRTELPYAFSD